VQGNHAVNRNKIRIVTGDLFKSECQTLINAVNCAGVMGKGIALEFKRRYPVMFKQYTEDCEAGGHRGIFDSKLRDDQLGTIALVRLLVKKLDVPVIAAGGIMDGAGIAAVLTMEAVATQLGTERCVSRCDFSYVAAYGLICARTRRRCFDEKLTRFFGKLI